MSDPETFPSAELQAIYDSLPTLDCKGLCVGVCGPVHFTMPEAGAATARTGTLPMITGEMRCGYLSAGRCTIYDMRPLVCRLYGAVDGYMACPHGCQPSRVMAMEEAQALQRQVVALLGPLRPIAVAEDAPDWLKGIYARIAESGA